jgi:hypothetical protein
MAKCEEAMTACSGVSLGEAEQIEVNMLNTLGSSAKRSNWIKKPIDAV